MEQYKCDPEGSLIHIRVTPGKTYRQAVQDPGTGGQLFSPILCCWRQLFGTRCSVPDPGRRGSEGTLREGGEGQLSCEEKRQ